MSSYLEPEKSKARSAVISSSIKALTKNRSVSTLARRSYVRDVRDYILGQNDGAHDYDALVAKQLSDKTVERWESFYDSIVQSRSPANLKVAYLSGPNPENDLRVFCDAGVLPENIWAFESENSVYSNAVVSALNSEFPFIKIINGGLDTFIEASPQKFDIIYLDFCGPLPSRNKKQKTLFALTRILAKHALNSPGALITNFSLPTHDQDEASRSLLSKLVSCYLYPKSFLENNESDENFSEGAQAHDFNPDEWFQKISKDLDYFYGQFITRLLIDHASLISPLNRFSQTNFPYTKFFNVNKNSLLSDLKKRYFHFDDECNGGNVVVDSGQYPILWALAALDKGLNQKDLNYPQFVFEDEEFAKFSELFLSQLDINNKRDDLVASLTLILFLLGEGSGQKQFWSNDIKELYKKNNFRNYHPFCDQTLFHQIFEALFRQVAIPYHVNINETKRWSYKAKDTPMYMDMLILDECRYLYDWMPTTDMFSNAISDIERQLSYRFVLDGVSKHTRWYNPEYFSGTAVIDQDTKGFEAKTLKPRKTIKK